jgi:N-acetylneuraminate lyase
MAPVNIDVDTFLTAACEQMPTLAGIKFTHDNLLEFGRLQARWGDRLEVLFGRDELLLPAIALGAQGAVGSFYGLTPNVFRQIWHCAAAGAASHAIEWSLCSNQLIDMCRKVGVPAAGKAMLASRGIGSGALRSPQLGLDADANRWLFSELANIKWPRAESPRSVPPPVGLPRGRADAVSTPER